jgi:hypothetical protein
MKRDTKKLWLHLDDGQRNTLVGIYYRDINVLIMIFTKEGSDSEEDSEDTAVRGVGRGKKKKLWPLSKKDGHAVLPSLDEQSLEDKKSILRAYFTSSYRMFPFGANL